MNINEIAKLAGVSRATVSRYLNEGYVSEEKKEIIRGVIARTGYEPSTQAQNLRKKVTKLIGVIIPKLQSQSVSRMVDGISEVLNKEGYQLLLANTGNDEKEELNYLRIFRKNQVDGIIFMGTLLTKAHYELAGELEVPLVVIGQQMEGYACVYQDDYHAAKQAAQLLLRDGKNVGYIGVTTKDKAVGAARRSGFVAALREKGEKEMTQYMEEAEFNVESAYEHTKILLTKHTEIDSIFCATDGLALGTLKYLHEKNIAVPQEIQLVGFGDTTVGNVVTPAISSVHFFYKTSGMEAARLLLEILNTGEDQKKEIKMGFKIVEKESTRK